MKKASFFTVILITLSYFSSAAPVIPHFKQKITIDYDAAEELIRLTDLKKVSDD